MATKKSADKGSPKAKAKGKSTTNKGGKGKGGNKTEPKPIEVPVIIPVVVPTDSDDAITVNTTTIDNTEILENQSIESTTHKYSIKASTLEGAEVGLNILKFIEEKSNTEEGFTGFEGMISPPQKRFKRCAAVDEEARRRGR